MHRIVPNKVWAKRRVLFVKSRRGRFSGNKTRKPHKWKWCSGADWPNNKNGELSFGFLSRSASHSAKMSLRKQTPSDFLKQIIGRPVVVKLNSGVDYRGVLACLDGYMNIALEQTEEYVNGQLKNKYGDAFIRGNNVLYISTQKRRM